MRITKAPRPGASGRLLPTLIALMAGSAIAEAQSPSTAQSTEQMNAPLAVAQQATQPTPTTPETSIQQPAAQPQAATPLPPVKVTAEKKQQKTAKSKPAKQASTLPSQATSQPALKSTVTGASADGSAAAGYRVNDVTTTGIWGNLPLQETPYSVNVMTNELIKNVQASSPDQLFRMNPLVQLQQPMALNASPKVNIRGFNIRSSQEDGMRDVNGWGNSLELYDRVEVLSGLSGFLYGSGNVGGMVNYVTKRPTSYSLADVTVGDFGAENYYVHGDFGGPVDSEGRVSYRLNLLAQDGDQIIDNSSQRRGLISGALDWRVTEGLTIEVNGSYIDYEQKGVPAAWRTSSTSFAYPSAPDASKLWSEPWTYQTLETAKVGANATWELNDVFTVRAAFRHSEHDDANVTAFNVIQPNYTYTQTIQERAPRTMKTDAGYAFVDASFSTLSIQHKLTTGYYADRYQWFEHPDEQASKAMTSPSVFSLSDPFYGAEPDIVTGTQPLFKDTEVSNRNFVIGDDIKFNQYWSALVGVTHARIEQTNWNSSGAVTPVYDQPAWTPTYSLLFSPVPWLTTYATYIESLEQGVRVPDTGSVVYTNAGQVLPPVMSEQYEVGAKATIGGMLFTAALYDIDKANYYVQNNGTNSTYMQDGREVHKGIELTATGNLAKGLRFYGGGTVFEATVKKTNNAALIDKEPANVSEQLVKGYLEYDLPFVPGLTLTGGVYYTGSFFADATNLQRLPGVTIADLGLRYATSVDGRLVVMRLNVTNLTDESYWLNNNYLGDPRGVAFSLNTKF